MALCYLAGKGERGYNMFRLNQEEMRDETCRLAITAQARILLHIHRIRHTHHRAVHTVRILPPAVHTVHHRAAPHIRGRRVPIPLRAGAADLPLERRPISARPVPHRRRPRGAPG